MTQTTVETASQVVANLEKVRGLCARFSEPKGQNAEMTREEADSWVSLIRRQLPEG